MRELRLARGLTQREVADALSIAQSHYAGMEIGRVPIAPHILAKLQEVYGWRVDRQQPRKAPRPRRIPLPEASSAAKTDLRDRIQLAAMVGMIALGRAPADWRESVEHHRKALRWWVRYAPHLARGASTLRECFWCIVLGLAMWSWAFLICWKYGR